MQITRISELCEKIRVWKRVHKQYPLEVEFIDALDSKGWSDAEIDIQDAERAGLIEVQQGRLVLVEGGNHE